MQHLSLNLKNKYIISCIFSYQIWCLKASVKVTTCSFNLSGYHVIKIKWPVEMGTFHWSNFRGCSFDYFSVIRSCDMKIYYYLILICITTKIGGYNLRGSCAMNGIYKYNKWHIINLVTCSNGTILYSYVFQPSLVIVTFVEVVI